MRQRRQLTPIPELSVLRAPGEAATKLAILKDRRTENQAEMGRLIQEADTIRGKLALAPKVEVALDELGRGMFDHLLHDICQKLSLALQDVMGQPIFLDHEVDVHKGSGMRVEFFVRKGEYREDLLKGQGGSVLNVLSVGLRLFSFRILDPVHHRPTLFLDEPDAWLSPELVPRLMRVISEASKALGYQVIVISHHDPHLLRDSADKMFEFRPSEHGALEVEILLSDAPELALIEDEVQVKEGEPPRQPNELTNLFDPVT